MGANPPTILIVDDTPENLTVLGELLQPTYRVRAANSGRRALQIALTSPTPDLILLDVMMPDMDGYDVLAELRAAPATQKIPVIFVTAMDSTDDEEHGLYQGAVDYITKPIRPSIVLARIRTQLELKQARDILSDQNSYLEAEVARRMRENQLIQEVSIHALARLAETRDPETGKHLRRTQEYVLTLARGLQKTTLRPLSRRTNHQRPGAIRPAARHRQSRHSRPHTPQARQADARRMGNHENPCGTGQ